MAPYTFEQLPVNLGFFALDDWRRTKQLSPMSAPDAASVFRKAHTIPFGSYEPNVGGISERIVAQHVLETESFRKEPPLVYRRLGCPNHYGQ